MLKKPGMILLVISISALLGSCHIKQEDEVTISRTTPNLRVYQPNDFIEYNVTAIINSDAVNQGTLRVKWTATGDLTDPIDGATLYPVLKETTTLTYEPNSTEPDVTIIRYISQDSVGSITLYAIGDGNDLYWLYDPANTGDLTSDIIRPVIFDSPMDRTTPPPNSPLEFSVMENCGDTPGLCGLELYEFNDSFTIVGDTTQVTTNIGKFSNPFEIKFSGTTIPNNSPTVSFYGDIRDACGTSTDQISHNGSMFVIPEIGIIRMTNLCQNFTTGGGEQVNYIITLSSTNIPVPSP